MDRTKILPCLTAVLLAGCSGPKPIVVGSKNFTEQVILGEIIAQHLEHRLGRPVERRFNLGGTLLAHQALVNRRIDLYPEYTGTALTAVLQLPPSPDAAAVLQEIRDEYRKRWRIEWMDPLGFNNTFVMVIRGEMARKNGIRTLSEASRLPWRLGAGYEFAERHDGLAGLLKTYDLRLSGSPVTMDLGLLYTALMSYQVDMVAANSTDGPLSVLDVQVLKDDRHYFPPYEAAIAVHQDSLRTHPGLRAALAELSGKFSDETMQHLNYLAAGEQRPERDIAAGFLSEVGLSR